MPSLEWRFDLTTSRLLWLLAHVPVAALGGAFALALVGILIIGLAGLLTGGVGLQVLLVAGLLLLVGGPASLLYLWPMLTEPDQRPRFEGFASDEMPFTRRSTVAAIAVGAVVSTALTAAGLSGRGVRVLLFLSLGLILPVTAFTTRGRIEDGRIRSFGAVADLSAIRSVRTLEVGGAVFVWVSYAMGTGLLAPRLLTIPAADRDRVLAAINEAERAPVDRNTDPIARVVLVATGLAFLAVAALIFVTFDRGIGFRALPSGVVGATGVLFLFVAWRGI
jgi:hypothetical protein